MIGMQSREERVFYPPFYHRYKISSQVFVVTETVVVPVREIAVADHSYFAVHEILGVRSVEEEHRQRQGGPHDPNDDGCANRGSFAHARPQRVHYGYVSGNTG